jgi:hypothetical protein
VNWIRPLWKAMLVVVAVGVALMHSTGHACTEQVCHAETAVVASMTDSHAAAHEEDGHHPLGSGMNIMQVCMAILTGLALAVSLWAVWRLARSIADGPWTMRALRAAQDSPVSLPSGGRLSFMELSVFRI